MEQNHKWWVWGAFLDTGDAVILLYVAMLPVSESYNLNLTDDCGEADFALGLVTYHSIVVEQSEVNTFLELADTQNTLDFSLLNQEMNHAFPVGDKRSIIGDTFGRKAVQITSYYTMPDLSLWGGQLEDLSQILTLLKEELNLAFDDDYSRKFGNFEIHEFDDSSSSSIAVQVVNNKKASELSAKVRIAKNEPLLAQKQMLHVICRESNDVIFNRLFELKSNEAVLEFELPEDTYEIEYWLFDESGQLLTQSHDYYLAEICMNSSMVGRNVNLQDKLTQDAAKGGKSLVNKASSVNRTHTERSVINPNGNRLTYKQYDRQFTELHPLLFPKSESDVWFGKSIENEVNVIGHFRRLIDNGRAEKAILVDPFFGADALVRFAVRLEESKLDLTILTSLGETDPDSGERIASDKSPVDELKKGIAKAKDFINCKLTIKNLNWKGTKQAFHDRYLIVYPHEGIPLAYLLSNSINKMAGKWPFCISKLEPLTAMQVIEYAESLCVGKDNSREGNDPVINFEWPEKDA